MNVVVRFAPSPTGKLHIGGIRTALFCYLFAKQQKGKFIIRTEDTDLERNENKYIKPHIEQLNYLGICEDESFLKSKNGNLYLQSKRIKFYQKYLQQLLSNKQAYYCFCSKEKLSKLRENFYKEYPKQNFQYPRICYSLKEEEIKINLSSNKNYCIRFHNSFTENFVFNDLICKNISFINKDVDDFVLLKQNGMPSYNYAVVIDDHLMNITHVIRGIEHLPNTAKQLALYKAFKWDIPKFAHCSLILNKQGKKLSKRNLKELNYLDKFFNGDFLPQAIINFTALLGFTPKPKHEIFSITKLINLFSFAKMHSAPATFDYKKLLWFNHKYLSFMKINEFTNYTSKIWKNYPISESLFLSNVLIEAQKNINSIDELPNYLNQLYEYNDDLNVKRKLIQKYELLLEINFFKIKKIVVNYLLNNKLNTLEDVDNIFLKIKTELKLSGKKLFLPIRILVTNKEHGFNLKLLLLILGKKTILERLK